VLADAGCSVVLHARRAELAHAIGETRENPDYLPGIRLPDRLRAPADYLVGEPVDLADLRAQVRGGRPMTGELLREVTDRMMASVRDQLAELRGEPAPTTTAPDPRRTLRGDLPGSAA
jgi:hypothetical protein